MEKVSCTTSRSSKKSESRKMADPLKKGRDAILKMTGGVEIPEISPEWIERICKRHPFKGTLHKKETALKRELERDIQAATSKNSKGKLKLSLSNQRCSQAEKRALKFLESSEMMPVTQREIEFFLMGFRVKRDQNEVAMRVVLSQLEKASGEISRHSKTLCRVTADLTENVAVVTDEITTATAKCINLTLEEVVNEENLRKQSDLTTKVTRSIYDNALSDKVNGDSCISNNHPLWEESR